MKLRTIIYKILLKGSVLTTKILSKYVVSKFSLELIGHCYRCLKIIRSPRELTLVELK